jgi:hypothetical protein
MNDEQKKMLLDWMRKVHQLEYAHRYESLDWTKKHQLTGWSAFIISTIIALTFRLPGIEPNTLESLPFFLKQDFAVAILSGVVALLTGFQTFFRPNEKSEIHKNTGSNYEKLRHRMEAIYTGTIISEYEIRQKLESIREEWEGLDAINSSSKNFQKGKEKVNSFNKYNEELGFLPTIT